jgi:hypothetical protein
MGLDILLAMNQMAGDESASELEAKGILAVDSQLITQVMNPRVVKIPFPQIARKNASGNSSGRRNEINWTSKRES